MRAPPLHPKPALHSPLVLPFFRPDSSLCCLRCAASKGVKGGTLDSLGCLPGLRWLATEGAKCIWAAVLCGRRRTYKRTAENMQGHICARLV